MDATLNYLVGFFNCTPQTDRQFQQTPLLQLSKNHCCEGDTGTNWRVPSLSELESKHIRGEKT